MWSFVLFFVFKKCLLIYRNLFKSISLYTSFRPQGWPSTRPTGITTWRLKASISAQNPENSFEWDSLDSACIFPENSKMELRELVCFEVFLPWIPRVLASFGPTSPVFMAYKEKQELFQRLWCFGQVPELRSTFSPCYLGWLTWSSHLQRICHFPVVPKQKTFSKVTLPLFAGLRGDRKRAFNRCSTASVFHVQDDPFSSFFKKKAGREVVTVCCLPMTRCCSCSSACGQYLGLDDALPHLSSHLVP